MTGPERVRAMRERMAELGRAEARFLDALRETNDPDQRAFFADLLERLALILGNERAGNTQELASHLHKFRADIRRFPLPDLDPALESRTPGLDGVRSARGNLVEALDNALEAAHALGMVPRHPGIPPDPIPRDAAREALIRLDERLRNLEAMNRGLQSEVEAATPWIPEDKRGQFGLINVHVGMLRVGTSEGRFETRSQPPGSQPRNTDLTALARTAEAIRDIGRDLRSLVDQVAPPVLRMVRGTARLVADAAERFWRGGLALRRLARSVRPRNPSLSSEQTSTSDVTTELWLDLPFDLTYRKIVASDPMIRGADFFSDAENAYFNNKIDLAETLYLKAASAFKFENKWKGIADSERRLADISRRRFKYIDAQRRYRAQLSNYVLHDDIIGIAQCQKGLATINLMNNQEKVALEYYRKALNTFQKHGDRLGEADCLWGIASISLNASKYNDAQEVFTQALNIYRDKNYLLGEANCVARLGDIAFRRAQHAAAKMAFEAALRLYLEIGERLGEANCTARLAELALTLSDYATAQAEYQAAFVIYQQLGDGVGEATSLAGLGQVIALLGYPEEARRRIDDAVARFEALGSTVNAEWARSLLTHHKL